MGTDQPPDKNHTLLYAFFIAMGVIFVLLLWIIFRKPGPALIIDNGQSARDSSKMLTVQIEEQKRITDHYLKQVDSLKSLPPKIKYFYYEQKKFNSTANIHQLDSVIRKRAGISKKR